jgi:hypothetical protein
MHGKISAAYQTDDAPYSQALKMKKGKEKEEYA